MCRNGRRTRSGKAAIAIRAHTACRDPDGVRISGLDRGTVSRVILGCPVLTDVVRGRGTHAQWRARVAEDLTLLGISPADTAWAIHAWLEVTGEDDPEIRALIHELTAQGTEVFLFINGTDRVSEGLHALRLGELTSEQLGGISRTPREKPHPTAYVLAHAQMEHTLGRRIARESVLFVDDRTDNPCRRGVRMGWSLSPDSCHELRVSVEAVTSLAQPQPSAWSFVSSMPKWCAISWTTVTVTSSMTSARS